MILAIIMVASLFAVAMPVSTAAATEYECIINGVPWESLADAMMIGAIDEATLLSKIDKIK